MWGAGVCGELRLPAQQRDDLTCMAGELHKNVPKTQDLRSQEGLLSKQLAPTSAQAPMLFLYN